MSQRQRKTNTDRLLDPLTAIPENAGSASNPAPVEESAPAILPEEIDPWQDAPAGVALISPPPPKKKRPKNPKPVATSFRLPADLHDALVGTIEDLEIAEDVRLNHSEIIRGALAFYLNELMVAEARKDRRRRAELLASIGVVVSDE